MFKNKIIVMMLILFITGIDSVVAQRNVDVKTLASNLNNFLDSNVRIEGIVDRHVSDNSDLGDYYLRDRYGDMIRIRTHFSKPEVNDLYSITGTFEEGPSIAGNRQFYIREIERIVNNSNVEEQDESLYTVTISSSPTGADVYRDGVLVGVTPFSARENVGTYTFILSKPFYNNANVLIQVEASDINREVDLTWSTTFYILIGLGFSLIFLILAYALSKPSGKVDSQTTAIPETNTYSSTLGSSKKVRVESHEPVERNYTSFDNPTIKFQQPVDKTVKILKGKFKVLEGLDNISGIQLHKNPTKSESEYTFGRNPGDSIYHFQLKSPTVSRNQAKLIIANEKYILINYASESSNPTVINGSPMSINGSHELHNGDIIDMGNVKLQFMI